VTQQWLTPEIAPGPKWVMFFLSIRALHAGLQVQQLLGRCVATAPTNRVQPRSRPKPSAPAHGRFDAGPAPFKRGKKKHLGFQTRQTITKERGTWCLPLLFLKMTPPGVQIWHTVRVTLPSSSYILDFREFLLQYYSCVEQALRVYTCMSVKGDSGAPF
jgi:hypothetical protein